MRECPQEITISSTVWLSPLRMHVMCSEEHACTDHRLRMSRLEHETQSMVVIVGQGCLWEEPANGDTTRDPRSLRFAH